MRFLTCPGGPLVLYVSPLRKTHDSADQVISRHASPEMVVSDKGGFTMGPSGQV